MTNASSDIRNTLAIGREAERSLRQTVEWLQKAHRTGKVDFWFDLGGVDLFKYWNLYRAKREGARSRQLLEEFRDALGDLRLESELSTLDRAGDPEFRFEPGVVLADVLEDCLGDLWAQGRIESRRRKANIALVRVRSVLRALERK